MGTSWPEKSSTHREKLIEELLRGRELAAQLQILLHKPFGDHGSHSPEELVAKISRSFTKTLSVLSSSESGEVRQNPATSHMGSPCDERGSEDSGEISKKRSGLKDQRDANKRRKTSQTWTMVSPSIEDGYSWRKYGQKDILSAKYPRSYFRCTHKRDEGCRATKQVQRIEEEPEKYRTTYIGHHNCKDAVNQMIIPDSDPENSYLIDFDIKHNHYPSSSSVKKEYKEEYSRSDFSDNLTSLGPILLPNSMAFESFGPAVLLLPPGMGSDSGDVVSGAYSCTETRDHSLDMGFWGGSTFDCDDYLHFDETATEFL